jgi:hypothetical protein
MKIRTSRTVRSLLVTLSLALILTLSPVQEALAYSFTGQKQCTYYIYWRWGGSITSAHKSAFQQALTDWNGVQSVRRFVGGTSTAPGAIDTYTAKDGNYGLSTWYYDGSGCITSWVSKLNNYYYGNFTENRSTANHELGHILGLEHTNNPAIMKIGRNRLSIYVPQTDDINGVNALY